MEKKALKCDDGAPTEISGVEVGIVPDFVLKSQEEQLEVPDNDEWDYFTENDNEQMENVILAHSPFKIYLITTCQWWPFTDKWERLKRRWVPFCCGQFAILCLIALSFVFDSGGICTVDTTLSYDWKFEITRIRNILWEARWLLGNFIGLWYFRTRHLEWFLKAVYMPGRVWRRFFKRAKHFMWFLMLTCIGIPTGIHIYVINAYSKESPQLWKETIHLIGYALRRYTTFPVFLALIAMLYLLDLFIKVSGEQIRYCLLNALRTNKDEIIGKKGEPIVSAACESSEIIGKMKEVISKTESRIKYFMLFHLVMLLLTAFLGIFSYMERLEFRIKSTPTNPGNLTNDMSLITLTHVHNKKAAVLEQSIRKAIVSLDETENSQEFSSNNAARTSGVVKRLKETLGNISQVLQDKEERLTIMQGGLDLQSIGVQLKEQINRTRLYIEIGLDCAETALLYGLPLFLLIKIDSSVAAVKERMINLQALQTTLKFDMTEEVWKVMNFMKTVRGIRIFGFQSTLFRTLILTFAGPILLSVVHSLLSYVNMPK